MEITGTSTLTVHRGPGVGRDLWPRLVCCMGLAGRSVTRMTIPGAVRPRVALKTVFNATTCVTPNGTWRQGSGLAAAAACGGMRGMTGVTRQHGVSHPACLLTA
jgi:hypothetical protein